MGLETITYFERLDGSSHAHEHIIATGLSFELYHKNPKFIEVSNENTPDKTYVINSHEIGDNYEKPIKGVSHWSANHYHLAGVWRVKYKA